MQQSWLWPLFSRMRNGGTAPTPHKPASLATWGHGQISPPTFWLEDGFHFLQKGLFHKGWGRAAHPHREVFAVHIKHDSIILGWCCRTKHRQLLSYGTEDMGRPKMG